MKTTQQLIELQRSITGARWIVDRAGVNVMDANEPLYCLAQCHENTLAKLQANATAIALVPELLAEVIRLREQLEESTALNENFASVSDPETLCHLSEYRAVIKQCRALLADAK